MFGFRRGSPSVRRKIGTPNGTRSNPRATRKLYLSDRFELLANWSMSHTELQPGISRRSVMRQSKQSSDLRSEWCKMIPKSVSKSGLSLVPNPRKDIVEAQRPSVQQSLFTETESQLIVFAFFPDLTDTTFVDLIRCADARVVLDLRRVPRFDIGRLNRHQAFDLFERTEAIYIDAAAQFGGKNIAVHLGQRINETVMSANGTVVFLFGSDNTSLATRNEVVALLENCGRSFQIVPVPA